MVVVNSSVSSWLSQNGKPQTRVTTHHARKFEHIKMHASLSKPQNKVQRGYLSTLLRVKPLIPRVVAV